METDPGRKDGCRRYGEINERQMDISMRVCGNQNGGRETHLYTTETNVVDIVITRDDSDINSYSYLIQYEGNRKRRIRFCSSHISGVFLISLQHGVKGRMKTVILLQLWDVPCLSHLRVLLWK